VGVNPAHVWDVSQTDGVPIPQAPVPKLLEGEAPAGLWDGLANQITAAGYELRLVSSATAIGGANGLTDFLTREVSIRADMDDAAQVKTLAHELGHVLLHDPDLSPMSTGRNTPHRAGPIPNSPGAPGTAAVPVKPVPSTGSVGVDGRRR